MSKKSRRPGRRNRHDRDRQIARPQFTSGVGSLDRATRRFSDRIGFTERPESPIPCRCRNDHRWWSAGLFQQGRGTFFETSEDRWCPTCGEPEEFSPALGARPDLAGTPADPAGEPLGPRHGPVY